MDKALLKDIVIDQKNVDLPDDFISRDKYKEILDLNKSGQIIIITGLRRVGKSTILQQLRKANKESGYYINFDDDRLVTFSLKDFQLLYEVFIELYGKQNTFYFDEIQNINGWERFVRRLHDNGSKIFITGSNASMLSRELGTHLTGRYIDVEIYPFSFREYVKYKSPKFLKTDHYTTQQKGELKRLFNLYYNHGGIPEYLKTGLKEYLQSLYESILYRDIIVRYKLSQEKAIKELAYYLASNIGQEVSFNSLKNLVGIKSATTISDYCSYLENSFLSFFINRYDYSLRKQLQYNKKQYFIDIALASMIGFRFSQNKGRGLENLVYIELKRRYKDIYFHKDKKECDFIIRDRNKIIAAIQVSVSLDSHNTEQREIEGLLEAMNKYNLREGYIITEDIEEEREIKEAGQKYSIHITPVWKWLIS